MKRSSAKGALLTSAIALVLCFVMLLGTTFAWFTDSVTSANNKIQAGTLKIDLLVKDVNETDYTSVKDDSKAIFDYTNWEPGYVEAKNVKVSTDGTLALKYTLKIVPNGEVEKLADVIEVYYAPTEVAVDRTLAGLTKIGTLRDVISGAQGTILDDQLIPAEAAATLGETANTEDFATIALKMIEEAGNEYQGKKIGTTFDINLFATQFTYEEDSFDNTYDDKADGKADPIAMEQNLNGEWEIASAGNFTYFQESVANGNDFAGETVVLADDVDLTNIKWAPVGTVDVPFAGTFDGAGNTISNLTVSDTDYAAFIAYAAKDAVIKDLTLENVNIESTKHAAGVVCIASEGIVIDNVTVSGTVKAPSYAGGILHNAANATITNCVNNADVSANRVGGIASWVTVGANISNVENNGDITGAVGAAGIAHGFAGKIENAVNKGTITSGNYEAAAGIVGVQKGASTYEYCVNYGDVKSTYDDANASAAGILGQSAGTASTLNYCANYGDITAEGSYAAGIAYSLYGTINASYCYNAGAIDGADGAGAIAPKAQYGTGDKANYCLNAGAITSANGKVYQGANNSNSCYYYDGADLLNVKDNTAAVADDALAVLNGGADANFFEIEAGVIIAK